MGRESRAKEKNQKAIHQEVRIDLSKISETACTKNGDEVAMFVVGEDGREYTLLIPSIAIGNVIGTLEIASSNAAQVRKESGIPDIEVIQLPVRVINKYQIEPALEANEILISLIDDHEANFTYAVSVENAIAFNEGLSRAIKESQPH